MTREENDSLPKPGNTAAEFLKRYLELTDSIRAAFEKDETELAGHLVERRGELIDSFNMPPGFKPGPAEKALYAEVKKAETAADLAAKTCKNALRDRMRELSKLKDARISYSKVQYGLREDKPGK